MHRRGRWLKEEEKNRKREREEDKEDYVLRAFPSLPRRTSYTSGSTPLLSKAEYMNLDAAKCTNGPNREYTNLDAANLTNEPDRSPGHVGFPLYIKPRGDAVHFPQIPPSNFHFRYHSTSPRSAHQPTAAYTRATSRCMNQTSSIRITIHKH